MRIQFWCDGLVWGDPERFPTSDAARAEFDRRKADLIAKPNGHRMIASTPTYFSYAYGKSRTAVVIGQTLEG